MNGIRSTEEVSANKRNCFQELSAYPGAHVHKLIRTIAVVACVDGKLTGYQSEKL